MNRSRFAEIALIVGSSLATLLLLSGAATAQTVKVEGLINGRSGDTMTLQTSDSPKLVVELTDDTQVAQVQGVFKARRKEMSMAALTPGLGQSGGHVRQPASTCSGQSHLQGQ